ncbi:hypothetical protein PHLGIDRAFT_351615 [Phlebiopsis gigantea 11061_1 CR5-6]|uniref:Uncharacterized protein n=1 Tax=Phlebiopsis gigantea (strain 11061_1 CR5-6) TaxID=745531 RepID=A0A0C3PPV3_PHLG1|nr:hypothetical protein PHLGIDRAFT_351615 [Phlebiopsis gigantea 11061_1 CR5-6]
MYSWPLTVSACPVSCSAADSGQCLFLSLCPPWASSCSPRAARVRLRLSLLHANGACRTPALPAGKPAVATNHCLPCPGNEAMIDDLLRLAPLRISQRHSWPELPWHWIRSIAGMSAPSPGTS